RVRVPEVQLSLGKLMGSAAVAGGRDGRVDVDEALWLFMRHWLVVRQHRLNLVDQVLGSATSTTAARSLSSLDTFHSLASSFEHLARAPGPPSTVVDLVYGEAYSEGLRMTRVPK
ncbi:unnamed protein product, partial [Choristocarpus tenellus]